MRALVLTALLPGLADASPCDDAIVEPIATPIRETDIQRSACLHDELSSALVTHALIDTPNFHGVIGSELALAGRRVVHPRVELFARLRVVDYTFVQTAVNKVTAARFGPLAAGAAFSLAPELALVALAELPYTRDEMDTLHASGHLGLAFTAPLASRHAIHARFATIAAVASSDGGTTSRLALRAGADLSWHPRRRHAFHYGLETEGGWRDGFSTLLMRAGWQWRPGGSLYRTTLGVGAPLLGDEPTTAIVSIGVARDLD
jgi:hypothetical protein